MSALRLPDLPRWVEAHGIAAAPGGWRVELGARGGFALGHDGARLAVIVHDADPAAAAALALARPDHVVLVAPEREDLADALRETGRGVARALLHTLVDPDALPDLDGAVPLATGTPLAHVPAGLAAELETARAAGTVWTVWVDDAPACFAYAPWRSEAWFDVSVDVLPNARQLGLGTMVAAAMIRDERARGREPVWGADEGNLASRRLAKRLGFGEPIDQLLVCASPPA
jgi:GNAT superfamily N-acetyltransferase